MKRTQWNFAQTFLAFAVPYLAGAQARSNNLTARGSLPSRVEQSARGSHPTQNSASVTMLGLGAFDQVSEAYINNLYIPTNGFDDNDDIQFMIEGLLPNPCYGISEKPRLEASHGNFTVRQSIYRKVQGPCAAPDSALKGIFSHPVPFPDEVVKLGVLQKGSDYKIFYSTTNGYQSRSFNVKAAPTDSIDSMNYARVENAYIPTRTFEGSPVKIVVQAALISSCQRATKEFKVSPDPAGNDLIVILPEVEIVKDDLCLPIYEPIEQVITVPNLKAGRYDLHVRSFNGASVNRIFNVY